MKRLPDIYFWIIGIIIVLVPFHALLTVWAGSNFGHYELLRLWEEFLLVAAMPIAAYLLYNDKSLARKMLSSRLVRLIAAYVALHLVLGVWALARGNVSGKALGYALVVNLRPVVFLVLAWLAAEKSSWLKARWKWLLLTPAVLVVLFGLAQITVLPSDFLRHFGYGPDTIQPYQTVDQKQVYVRIQSTLRGANPLGAYLVVVLSAAAALALANLKRWKKAIKWMALGFGAIVVMVYTYSRSAFAGAIATFVSLAGLSLNSRKVWRWLAAGLVTVVALAGLTFVALRNNDRFQNVFFHTDEHSTSVSSSNNSRLNALERGARDVVRRPLGQGPGTAGPASQYNSHPARISENYFLQIGQEVGWLGLALFVTINVVLVRELWWRRNETLSKILLASGVGITIICLVSHAWTDDTLAYVWWGLAGIMLGSHEKVQKAKS